MKNLIVILFALMITVSCNSQKKIYSDFDMSYSKSGGFAPIYENLLIKDNIAHYSFEGQGKKNKTTFKLTDAEMQNLHQILTTNNFRHIAEDRKKIYDGIAVTISVKNGKNSGSKTDASMIMPQHQSNWENIVNAFQEIISKNVKNTP